MRPISRLKSRKSEYASGGEIHNEKLTKIFGEHTNICSNRNPDSWKLIIQLDAEANGIYHERTIE